MPDDTEKEERRRALLQQPEDVPLPGFERADPNGSDLDPPADFDKRSPPAGAAPAQKEPARPPPKTYDFGIFTPTEEMLAAIKPRPWLYGTFLQRGYVSVLSGISGGGKSSLVMTMAVELAAHRPLLGHFLWNPLSVWYCNLDDPRDEINRRLKAVLLHYEGKVSLDSLEGRLILSGRNPEFIIAKRNPVTNTIVAEPLKEALIGLLCEREIDVLIVDPFVRTHGAEENSNPEMAEVMKLWIELAEQAQAAILLLHHVRKGTGRR